MKNIRTHLYDHYERHFNNLYFYVFWSTGFCLLVIYTIFLFDGNICWTIILILLLFLVLGILSFAWLHASASHTIFTDKDITIYRKSGLRKLIKIDDIEDVLIGENQTRIAQTKKNKGTYYGLYFKLKNGKKVMVAEVIHITTLINFLKEFLRYYGDKLPEQCTAHIQQFIDEKKNIFRRFEGDA